MKVTYQTPNGVVWTSEVPGPGLDQRTFDARVERGEYVVLDPGASADTSATGADDPDDDLVALRAEYEAVTGEPADRRWKPARLRKEIAAARDDEGD